MDNKRLILFLVFSFGLLMLWDRYQAYQNPQVASSAAREATIPAPAPAAPANTQLAQAPAPSSDALSKGRRVVVKTDLYQVEIDENGGDLRQVTLLKHRSLGDGDGPLTLLDDHAKTYVVQSGLTGAGLPNHRTVFVADQAEYRLADGQQTLEVRLTADTGGAQVTRTYTFHRNDYVIDQRVAVVNHQAAPLATSAYFHVLRDGQPPEGASQFQQTYTGPVVYTQDAKYHKVDFESVRKGKAEFTHSANDGWVALIQHYYLSAWLPKAGQVRENYIEALPNDLYRVGVKTAAIEIAPGQTAQIDMSLYVGPQEQHRLAELSEGLELTTDYGWLTIIAKPLFHFLELLHAWVGNWGLAIILLTLVVKALFYPLSAASYRSMAKMRVLAPKMQQLKERYGEDKQRMQVELMKLYQTEKINPLGGCLPILVQIPVFISLYYALIASVELRNAPFYGWITDLSVPDPYFVLPILMGISMVVQSRLNPPPPDPIQARVMQIMPIAFSVFFFFFASGLVLYWLVNNVLSIAQQWRINSVMEREKASVRR